MTNPIQPADSARALRRATAADAALLAELGARLFEQTFGPTNRPEDMRAYLAKAFTVDVLSGELTDPARVSWIAEDAAGAPIGYTTLCRGTNGDGVIAARPAEIQRIYADQHWHGRGTGNALMRTCIEQAGVWHCDVIWLAVWEKNPRAIAFYEKMSFRVVGSQRFTLGSDVQQDLVMARVLT